MIGYFEGTPVEVEPVIARARRAGRPVAVARLASGRVRVTVGAPGGPAPPASTDLVPAADAGGLPLWVPLAIGGVGVVLVVALVALAAVWARGHADEAAALVALALMVGGWLASVRLKRR